MSFDEGHGKVGAAIILADFVHRTDIRMIERGGSTSLAVEPLHLGFFIGLKERYLQGYLAVEFRIVREKDGTHATLAEYAENTVRPEALRYAARTGGGLIRWLCRKRVGWIHGTWSLGTITKPLSNTGRKV